MKDEIKDMNSIVHEMYKGIIEWYSFEAGKRALIIDDKDNAYTEYLCHKGLEVVTLDMHGSIDSVFLSSNVGMFDYIIAIGCVEKFASPGEVIEVWKGLLKDDKSKLLIGANNRFGIKYFCGDRDPYTKYPFDGIEDYQRFWVDERVSLNNGRCYSQAELKKFISATNLNMKFYSVMPSLESAQLIYDEDSLPEEDLAMRYIPMYNYPDTVFLNEGKLYDGIIENGMFHKMANAYFIECTKGNEFCDVENVTLSLDRGEVNSVITVLYKNGTAGKYPVYEEGKVNLQKLCDNSEELKAHGVNVVESESIDGYITMPRIKAPVANVYLQNLLLKDKEKFIEKMDEFRDIIYTSSDHESENEYGIVLKKAYFDLVPLNAFVIDDKFVFYDQEFYVESYPANAILYRAITIIYDGNAERESALPSISLFDRYGLTAHLEDYTKMTHEFLMKLRNQDELEIYNREHLRNLDIITSNRARMNTAALYENNLLESCFDDIGNKKVIVFGSGKYADKFMALYKDEYEIAAVVDNNKDKWGQEFKGRVIEPPAVMMNMSPSDYKVIICVKRYEQIYKQLLDMGVKYIGAYDYSRIYKGRQATVPPYINRDSVPKKYHIGYCAGVYDLYHIGHLNIFRRAKQYCDYLIVGVVSDECVRKNKKREPYIPFEERIELVRNCKYVDEAVEIPYGYERSIEAFEKLHFDCQFSGSDYEHDPGWLAVKSYLEEHGSTMEFFPYTESTSSTKIKGLIEKGLL